MIRQHDHGMLSGDLALAWDGENFSLPFTTAVAFHDYPWLEEDRQPRWSEELKGPHDFLDLAKEIRLDFYQRGLDRMEEIHPYVGLLGSLHYTSFPGEETPQYLAFQEGEKNRRDRLKEILPEMNPDQISRDIHFLKLFDDFSLYICLYPPGHAQLDQPEWLQPEVFALSPDGVRYTLEWSGEDKLTISPFPLKGPLTVEIPYRDIPQQTYLSEGELLQVWREAPLQWWNLKIG